MQNKTEFDKLKEKNDKLITYFQNKVLLFRNDLQDHLDRFMPLSSEDEEKDWKKVLKILNKYI